MTIESKPASFNSVVIRSEIGWIVAVIAVAIALWAPRFRGPIDLRYDAGVYYILGTSLAEGKGYRITSEPGDLQAVQYPPMLPAIVAMHQAVLGTSDPDKVGRVMRFTYFAFTVAYLLATYVLARRFLRPAFAFAATLLCALYLHTWFMSDFCFAEIPYALTATIFCVLATRTPTLGTEAGMTVTAVIAFLLRSMGLAVLGAWVADAVLRRDWKRAGYRIAIALIPFLLWQLYISGVKHSPEYTKPAYAYQRAPYQFYNVPYIDNVLLIDSFAPELGTLTKAGLIKRTAINALSMPLSLGEAVSAPRDFWTWFADKVPGLKKSPKGILAITFILGLLVITGIGVWIARKQWIFPIYIGASMALICLTPWPGQYARYLGPIAALLTIALMQAVVLIADWVARKRNADSTRMEWIVATPVLSVALALQAFTLWKTFRGGFDPVSIADAESGKGAYKLFYHDVTWREFNESVEWLKRNAKPSDIVATDCPHVVYLRTGLKAVMPPFEIDADRGQELLDTVPTRYLIMDSLKFVDITRRYTAKTLKAHPTKWVPVFTTPKKTTTIYRRAD